MNQSINPPENGTHPESPCIWMQAGVVKKKNCAARHDCPSCRYDTAMEKAAVAGRHITWQDAMRKKDSTARTCRHTMSARADHRICPMNYNCDRCAFDQLLEDTLAPGAVPRHTDMKTIKGFVLADGYHFHEGHTWTCIDPGGFIRIGIDDFTFKVLGGPDAFDLPLMGQELNRNRPGWGMKRQGNLADILSPINGVITKVNHDLTRTPELAKDHPYGAGWLFTVHNPNIKDTITPLMTGKESEQWLSQDISTLEEMIEKTAGPMTADGGLLSPDVYGNLPSLGWSNLTRRFLKTHSL